MHRIGSSTILSIDLDLLISITTFSLKQSPQQSRSSSDGNNSGGELPSRLYSLVRVSKIKTQRPKPTTFSISCSQFANIINVIKFIHLLQSIVTLKRIIDNFISTTSCSDRSRRQQHIVQNTMSLVVALPSLKLPPQVRQSETPPLHQFHPTTDLVHSLSTAAVTRTRAARKLLQFMLWTSRAQQAATTTRFAALLMITQRLPIHRHRTRTDEQLLRSLFPIIRCLWRRCRFCRSCGCCLRRWFLTRRRLQRQVLMTRRSSWRGDEDDGDHGKVRKSRAEQNRKGQ